MLCGLWLPVGLYEQLFTLVRLCLCLSGHLIRLLSDIILLLRFEHVAYTSEIIGTFQDIFYVTTSVYSVWAYTVKYLKSFEKKKHFSLKGNTKIK